MKRILLSIGLIGLPPLGVWLGMSYCEARRVSDELISGARIGHIEFQLQVYHQRHGKFPPTKYQVEPDGPIHSWRVLLLVTLRERHDYDFSLMWNNPTNLQVLEEISRNGNYFVHDNEDEITHYLSIGEDEPWPATKPLRSRLVTKGNDRFLIVEDPDSRIRWMEPRF